MGFVAEVSGEFQGFAAGLLHPPGCLLGVVLVFRQIGDRDVGSFSRVGDRNRPADAAVSARDEGDASFQPAQSTIRFFSVVGLRRHLGIAPRIGLLFLWKVRFRSLFFGILDRRILDDGGFGIVSYREADFFELAFLELTFFVGLVFLAELACVVELVFFEVDRPCEALALVALLR